MVRRLRRDAHNADVIPAKPYSPVLWWWSSVTEICMTYMNTPVYIVTVYFSVTVECFPQTYVTVSLAMFSFAWPAFLSGPYLCFVYWCKQSVDDEGVAPGSAQFSPAIFLAALLEVNYSGIYHKTPI